MRATLNQQIRTSELRFDLVLLALFLLVEIVRAEPFPDEPIGLPPAFVEAMKARPTIDEVAPPCIRYESVPVSISWRPPYNPPEASPLAGYRVHYGPTFDSLDHVVEVDSLRTRVVLFDLPTNSVVVSVQAVNELGLASPLSEPFELSVFTVAIVARPPDGFVVEWTENGVDWFPVRDDLYRFHSDEFPTVLFRMSQPGPLKLSTNSHPYGARRFRMVSDGFFLRSGAFASASRMA